MCEHINTEIKPSPTAGLWSCGHALGTALGTGNSLTGEELA